MAGENIIPGSNDISVLERAMGIKPAVTNVAPVVVPPAEQAPAPPPSVEQAPEKNPEETTAELDIDKLTDDQINALIEKKTGKKIKLEDLSKPEPPAAKTKEEIEADEAKIKKDALAWAIDNGKIKKDKYDASIVGNSKTDREIALSIFSAETKADDKDISDEEIEEMFRDAYHESDPESKLFKKGQDQIATIARNYRKENYTLPDYETEYRDFVKLNDNFKSYKATVKKVAAELPKELTFTQPYKYLDGPEENITYTIPVDEKLLGKIISDATSEAEFLNRGADGKVDEKQLEKTILHNVRAVMFESAITKMLADNTREVEKRMEVVLGNKRNGAPELNAGKQNLAPRQTAKPHDYTMLEKAMGNRR